MAPPKRDIFHLQNLELNFDRINEVFKMVDDLEGSNDLVPLFKVRAKSVGTYLSKFEESYLALVAQAQTLEDGGVTLANLKLQLKLADDNVGKIQAKLESLEPLVDRSIPTNYDFVATVNQNNVNNCRLPKLQVKTFNGNYTEWQTFIDMYNSMIHNKTNLSNVDKFNYLTSYLEGEPLRVIKQIPLSDINYPIAYDALVSRYSNKRILAMTHWHVIKNYPCLKSDNYRELRILLDIFSENLSILKTLGFDVASWDFLLLDLLLEKIENTMFRTRFELQFKSSSAIPSFENLKEFLSDECNALEMIHIPKHFGATYGNRVSKNSKFESRFNPQTLLVNTRFESQVSNVARGSNKCPLCSDSHSIVGCNRFLEETPFERYDIIKRTGLCFNCLGPHFVANCASKYTCRVCSAHHHSLLHFDWSKTSTTPVTSYSNVVNSTLSPGRTTLLATAVVKVLDKWGGYQKARALIDPGSQISIITDLFAKQLGLSRHHPDMTIFGIGHSHNNGSRGATSCTIYSAINDKYLKNIEVGILNQIASHLPNTPIDSSKWSHMQNLQLADPEWYRPAPIELLLGADVFPSIICDGNIHDDLNKPAALNTIFGWILLGPVQQHSETSETQSLLSYKAVESIKSVEPCLDSTLRNFWEVEEVPASTAVSPDDTRAENLFVESVVRNESGRFTVALPFKDTPPCFSGSQSIADRRLLSLERKLTLRPKFRDLYLNFMQDYLSSGNMSVCPQHPIGNDSYFIPHHGILKQDGENSKIRVVFDASARCHNNLSLNDILLVGPKLQNNIVQILLRFRIKLFVFCCDVRQMYRQILIDPNQRKYQLIRWRFSPSDPIETYQLNTVTYGVSSAPFLAIRTLLKLAEIGKLEFPLASEALQNDSYVDDIICGSQSLETALELQSQLIALLKSGCFELRKWSSNHPALIETIPENHRLTHPSTFDSKLQPASVTVLGLHWIANRDSFSFVVSPINSNCTKRNILSTIARIYDPLGFICPITFFAKHFIQHLWTLGLGWDETPPLEVESQWLRFRSQLSELSSLQIPRQLGANAATSCELHAFCDASERGYATVIYFRFKVTEEPIVRFVIAKSKVAPLKRISIPRLELCAAVLLTNLVDFVVQTFRRDISISRVCAWSDSRVVLAWIQSSPHRWKVFVANRVTHIQSIIPPDCWRHVRSSDNPADPASRGLLPNEISTNHLWWSGPPFLLTHEKFWNSTDSSSNDDSQVQSEERKLVMLVQGIVDPFINLINKFSSLEKILRIVAYVLRFCNGRRAHKGNIDKSEQCNALVALVRIVQRQVFDMEIEKLVDKQPCFKHIQKLSPFLDVDGTLRVGGRLSLSNLPFPTKHPAILPQRHRLTELLIYQTHNDNCHPGINTTMYLIQQNFWILSARRSIRHYLSKCIRCFRVNPSPIIPAMGNLPEFRVSQVKPFSKVGVDFGGPFNITMTRRRGAKTTKAYLCLFICLSTKALHLEIASDLSSETFLAALRRFIARRGRCNTIVSDCGTNFVGANRELIEMFKHSTESESISWSFNPPSAPHFGGIWESGIKSVKTHIYRVVGIQVLTYEELNTLIVQIEALLNSRPLCSLSSDPNDLSSLTPGHFLTLEPLTAPPNPDLGHLALNRLSRWQFIQRLQHDFWHRWRDEYLHTLYQRGKWAKSKQSTPLDIGSMVLIKDDQAPPLQWHLGRVQETILGPDGICRVAKIYTKQGVLTRPLVKLCPLPNQ